MKHTTDDGFVYEADQQHDGWLYVYVAGYEQSVLVDPTDDAATVIDTLIYDGIDADTADAIGLDIINRYG